MLGLGASHLASTDSDPGDMNFRALNHQMKALNQLRPILNTPAKNHQEADARFATFMVLIFQSAYMTDGLVDFFTMLRGCVIQGGQVNPDTSNFVQFLNQNHMSTVDNRVEWMEFQPVDTEELERFAVSVTALKPYCSEGIELEYQGTLFRSAKAASASHRDGKGT
jgi:hypothetical protein